MNPGEQVQESQHNLLEWLRDKASGPGIRSGWSSWRIGLCCW